MSRNAKSVPNGPTGLGERIRQFRKHHGMRQRDLAEKVGVGLQTIVRWEGGETEPPIGVVGKLLEIDPGLNIWWLHVGSGEMHGVHFTLMEKAEEGPDLEHMRKSIRYLLDRLPNVDRDESLLQLAFGWAYAGEIIRRYRLPEISRLLWLGADLFQGMLERDIAKDNPDIAPKEKRYDALTQYLDRNPNWADVRGGGPLLVVGFPEEEAITSKSGKKMEGRKKKK